MATPPRCGPAPTVRAELRRADPAAMLYAQPRLSPRVARPSLDEPGLVQIRVPTHSRVVHHANPLRTRIRPALRQHSAHQYVPLSLHDTREVHVHLRAQRRDNESVLLDGMEFEELANSAGEDRCRAPVLGMD